METGAKILILAGAGIAAYLIWKRSSTVDRSDWLFEIPEGVSPCDLDDRFPDPSFNARLQVCRQIPSQCSGVAQCAQRQAQRQACYLPIIREWQRLFPDDPYCAALEQCGTDQACRQAVHDRMT